MIEDGRTPISKALKQITITRSAWDSLNARVKDLEERLARIEKYVDELTRQRDSARDLAVKSGIFQDHRGTEYLPDPDHPWRADPVGVVAWDKQVEQR